MIHRPCVLVFAGSDPSGGAGIQADIEAIAAQGAHALPIITALTVQDNDRVYAVHPVATDILLHQAETLARKIPIAAIKIGIVANRANAQAIADWILTFKKTYIQTNPARLMPEVVLDPVLGSGHGDALAVENAVYALLPLLEIATLVTPNLPEAALLCPNAQNQQQQADYLMSCGALDVLIKGGHGTESRVSNNWFHAGGTERWEWPRLPGAFHGSGCTLAAAIAGQLAVGHDMPTALQAAQAYCQHALEQSYSISSGQRIPQRVLSGY